MTMRNTLQLQKMIVVAAIFALAGYYGGVLLAQQQARWHRYQHSRLDATTQIDVVKDVYSQRCYAVYRIDEPGVDAQSSSVLTARDMRRPAVASLGEVPCEARK